MFLENPSSGTLKIERLESKIILKCLGVIRPKGVATVSFIGLQLDLYRVVTFWGYTYLYIKYGINKQNKLKGETCTLYITNVMPFDINNALFNIADSFYVTFSVQYCKIVLVTQCDKTK